MTRAGCAWANGPGAEQIIVLNPETGGGHPMSLATAPNGTIIGATYIPQQVFNYNPQTASVARYEPFTQWNALDVSPDGLLYVVDMAMG